MVERKLPGACQENHQEPRDEGQVEFRAGPAAPGEEPGVDPDEKVGDDEVDREKEGGEPR